MKNPLTRLQITLLLLAICVQSCAAYGPTTKPTTPAPPVTVSGSSYDTNSLAMNFYYSTSTMTNNALFATVPLQFTNGVAYASAGYPQVYGTSYMFLAEDTNTVTGAASPYSSPALWIAPSGPLTTTLSQPVTLVVK